MYKLTLIKPPIKLTYYFPLELALRKNVSAVKAEVEYYGGAVKIERLPPTDKNKWNS